MGWFPLGLGLVMEDEPAELSLMHYTDVPTCIVELRYWGVYSFPEFTVPILKVPIICMAGTLGLDPGLPGHNDIDMA